MRKLFFATLLLFSFSKGYSAYLVNVPQTLQQPDGTILHCFASGDEFYNWLHDSLGYTIVENPQTGYYVYALPGEDGKITASNYIVGVANPVILGLPVRVSVSSEIITTKRAAFEAEIPKARSQKSGGNNIGTINNLVVFIRFADANFSRTFAFMETMFNDSSSFSANSVYNFYRLSSYGQLYLTSHFFPAPSANTIVSYQDANPRNYYRPQSSNNPEGYASPVERVSRLHSLLSRAIQYIAQNVPSDLAIDYDNDGDVDNVSFILAGNPDGWNDLLWPHRSSLYSTTERINGKRVYDYNLLLENTNYSPFPGVIAHELMHTLGAPDLYRYYDNTVSPLGSWDLMASTDYSRPQGLGAYMKYKYGMWIPELPEITDTGIYTLYPANNSTMIFDAEKPIGYRINMPDNPNEYFVLEYRKINECFFEAQLPGAGILIYRINKTQTGNAPADGIDVYDEVYLFRPGGEQLVDGNLSMAHFSANTGRTFFDKGTSPFPFYCNGDIIESFSIVDITDAGDSIQFRYMTNILNVSKAQVDFGPEAGNTETITVSSDTPWEITEIDTSWLEVDILSGDIGTTTIQLSTRTQNNLRVPKSCSLTLKYGVREKQITVSQRILSIDSCQGVNNQYTNDITMEYNFQQYGVNAVSEYFSATNDLQVIDSVSFYFGTIATADLPADALKLEIYATNAVDRPVATLLTQEIDAKALKPNAWNTIRLQEPVVTQNGLTVGYSFTGLNYSSFRVNILTNGLRTEPYYGTMLVRLQNGEWRKPSEVSFTGIKNYSLAMKLFVCPPSPSSDTLLVDTTCLSLPYDSNAQTSFNIVSNTYWDIVNFPEGYSISQNSGTGDANLIITTLTKHREAKKTVNFLVRSGSIIHKMVIERATHPLISNKKEVELNYAGTDSAEVYITATGTNWTAETNCEWLRLPITTGNAGMERLVIYPTGENNTNAAFEGCVNVVSTTLNESICIVVSQNSIVGIQQPANASILSLYPNPASSQLSVDNGNVLMQTIVVYNVVGKEVLKISDVNNSHVELPIADLMAGIYFVKVSSEKGIQVRKFVKIGK